MKPTIFFTLSFVGLTHVSLASLQAFELTVKKPNVVVILADDMGRGNLRCHGNSDLDTPALDKLQTQSVELEHFYGNPICSPTRSSLLSSRHHARLRE
jgi:arylsulfatase A-like enzyme